MYQTLFEKKMSHRHYFFQKKCCTNIFQIFFSIFIVVGGRVNQPQRRGQLAKVVRWSVASPNPGGEEEDGGDEACAGGGGGACCPTLGSLWGRTMAEARGRPHGKRVVA